MEMFFRKIEYFIEGDAPAQKVLAKMPWNREKILKKSTKHIVFYFMSFIIANFFLAYIIGMKQLISIITDPLSAHIGGLLAIAVFSGVFYAVYAFFREQACTVVCPYGRLQSVLLDQNSMIVAYDYKRGEPRGKATKKAELNLGDCVDCSACVRVCPTGIDIRNGTQMECVGCTACIDACDDIMTKLNLPTGLIRYASESGIKERKPLKYTGRMKFYTVVLILLASLLSFLLITRKDITATVMRTPGMLYQERGTDSISNLYNIKIANKTIRDIPLEVKLEGTQGSVQIIGGKNIQVKKEGQGSGSFFIVLPAKEIKKRSSEIKVNLYDNGKLITTVKTKFLGPVAE
jgi:cytochrome c oxidase accessory protein FixG